MTLRKTAVIYANPQNPTTQSLNRLMAAAHDDLARRGLAVTGTYIDLDPPPDGRRPGLEALIAAQEDRRAAPLIYVRDMPQLARRTDTLFTILRRLDAAGAQIIGPGFDQPLGAKEAPNV